MMFGNLSIKQLEDRTGWKLSENDFNYLKEHKQDNAQHIEKDKLHIFDLPFVVLCGEDIVDEVVKILKSYEDKQTSKEKLQIALQQK